MTEAEKAAEQINKSIADLNTKIENGATKEELQNELNVIKEANKDFVSKDDYTKMNDTIKSLEDEILKLKESKEVISTSKKGVLSEFFKKNANEANELIKTDEQLKSYEDKNITIKAPALMTTANVKPISGGEFNQLFNNYIDNEIGVDPKPDNFIMNLVNVITQPNAAKIWWVERENEEGDAQFVSEGELAPLIDGEWQEKSEDMYEAAVAWKFSKRLLNHTSSVEQDFRTHANELVEQELDDAILSGDNSVDTKKPNGITTLAGAFVSPAALANYYPSANIYDAINATATRVRLNNFKGQITCVLGTVWEAKMKGIKNANGDYILPHFVTPDGKNVGSVMVEFQNKMPETHMLIGDLKKFNTVVGDSFQYSEFHENDDARKRLITKMLHGDYGTYIKGTDAGAIIYNSISDVLTQIETV